MPRSIVVVPTTTNLIYDADHQALDPVELADVANQDKYLRNTGGILEWRAKNVANGLVELNSLALIDSTLLPSYVDDILTYANLASFPVTGETGKIYVDESNGYSYRWTGSSYYCISTQSFYTKTELDTQLGTKLNLSGGTMTGNIAMGTNNLSGVGTITGTNAQITNLKANDGTTSMTISNTSGDVSHNSKNVSGINSLTATTANLTNLAGCTLTGTLTTGSQSIYGVSGAVDMLNLKGLNLRSRDDAICATLDTGSLVLQNNMNANSKNISSVATLGATTGNITTVNATTVNATNIGGATLTGAINANSNNISSIATASGTTATFTNVNPTTLGACTLGGALNAGSNNISSIATASGTTATFTNVNPTNLGGCTTTGSILLGSNTFIYGPSNNNTVHVQNLKGDILVAGTNAYNLANMTGSGLQLLMDLDANNTNINNANKIEFASLAGGDGTVIATSTSNFLTMSRAINMNSQNMDNVGMINALSYKGCKKYQVTGTSINGSNNLSITVDTGFTVVSFYCTVDLRARTNDKFLVTDTIVDWTETLGTAGLGIVLTVLAIQN